MIDPLVEELLHAAAGDLLDRAHKVGGLHRFAAIANAVFMDTFPEKVVTDLTAQHVQDPSALGVGPDIEKRVGAGVRRPDNRRPLRALVRLKNLVHVLHHLVVELVLAEIVLRV